MTEKYNKPFFDSSFFIAGLRGEICRGIKRGVVFEALLDEAREGKFKLIISSIAIVEVFKKRRFTASKSKVFEAFADLIEEEWVGIVEVDREIAIAAQGFCRKYADQGLSPMDSIHLACALRAECDVLLTWDRPFAKISHDKIRIIEPSVYSDKPLLPFTEHLATKEEIETYEATIKRKPEDYILVPSRIPRCGGDDTTDKAAIAKFIKGQEAQERERGKSKGKRKAVVIDTIATPVVSSEVEPTEPST